MIFFPSLAAVATCEAPECKASTPIALALTVSGGFAGAAATSGWQFLNDGAVFRTFCPEHHQEPREPPRIQPIPHGIQIGPRGLRPMNGKRG